MRVSAVTDSYLATRPHVYYAGTHLVNYDPSHYQKNTKTPSSKAFIVANNSSAKERVFLRRREDHQTREELLQRLNYINGVHYSQLNQIHS